MAREKICCIYMLKSKINGKIYIGQTVDYYRRMNEYKNRRASHSDSSKYSIMYAIEKDGFDSFESSIVRYCKKDELDYYEMYYIGEYKSYMKKYGYNSFHKTNASGKFKMNRSTKAKMSKAHVGLTETAVTKRKKSHPVIAIKKEILVISDSAKLFGDQIGKERSSISWDVKNGVSTKGWYVFYADANRRKALIEEMKEKGKTPHKEYKKLLKYLDNSSVETIERDYVIINTSYDHQ